jgi:hypothetical protein
MWKPIESEMDLPALQTRERSDLDFKAAPTADAFENAKDVAAFANASGGTILVGACGGDRLTAWKPLSSQDAKTCCRAYEEAVRDRCKPAPLFSIVELPFDNGIIVGVNVWPFPGQPVGVQLTKKEVACCEGAVFFPRRVCSQTKAITPEQIPMFVDAKVRRVAMTLERIVGQRVVLTPVREASHEHNVATLVSMSLLENLVRFGAGDETPFTIPLDMIESAYRDEAAWHIFMHGVVRDFKALSSAPPEMKSSKKFFPLL